MSEPPPPGDDHVSLWVGLLKSLTLSNVLVIALLVIIAIPAYTIYRALGDDKLLDRLLSTYEEKGDRHGCTLRHVQQRGGPDLWGISSGFAFMGEARWFVNVALTSEPDDEEIASYCESLKLIADKMLDRHDDRNGGLAGNDGGGADGEVHGGSMPGAETDGGRHDRLVPAKTEEAE